MDTALSGKPRSVRCCAAWWPEPLCDRWTRSTLPRPTRGSRAGSVRTQSADRRSPYVKQLVAERRRSRVRLSLDRRDGFELPADCRSPAGPRHRCQGQQYWRGDPKGRGIRPSLRDRRAHREQNKVLARAASPSATATTRKMAKRDSGASMLWGSIGTLSQLFPDNPRLLLQKMTRRVPGPLAFA
jgi:hypothetical protein